MVGKSLLMLEATDADSDLNGPPFTWELINQPSITPAFTMTKEGVLTLATTRLDYKVPNYLSMHRSSNHNSNLPRNANKMIINYSWNQMRLGF